MYRILQPGIKLSWGADWNKTVVGGRHVSYITAWNKTTAHQTYIAIYCILVVNYMCGGGGIVGNHVWVTVVVCTCMLSCTPLKVFAWALGYYI